METFTIITYIAMLDAAFIFTIVTAIFFYKAGDECWNRSVYIFLGVLSNIITIALFCTLTWRLTCNAYGVLIH